MKNTNKDDKNKDIYERYSAFHAIADRCRLSVVTVRDAFSKKPITWGTAMKLARSQGIPIEAFRIKQDERGRRGVNKNAETKKNQDGE